MASSPNIFTSLSGTQKNAGDTRPAGALVAVAGSPLTQNVAQLQTGVQLNVSERTSLGRGYSGQCAEGVEKHDLSARFAAQASRWVERPGII